jgi:hypothetical protein
VVVRYGDGLGFGLQSRGIAAEDMSRLEVAPVDINVASEHGCRYCPFCGTDLSSLIERARGEFDNSERVTSHFWFGSRNRSGMKHGYQDSRLAAEGSRVAATPRLSSSEFVSSRRVLP